MRLSKITLITNSGYPIPLNKVTFWGFIRDVNGLGFEVDTTYKKIDNEYILLNRSYNQMQIKGTIDFNFKDTGVSIMTPQQAYEDFVRYITDTPLKIEYQPVPFTNQVYYRDGEITEVNFDETKTKKVDITFTTTGLWYKKNYYRSSSEPVSDDRKVYDYTYNFRYGGKGQRNTIELLINTYIPSHFKLIASGSLVNPVWTYYNSGEYVASGKLNYTIPEGYKLVIDTSTKPYGLYMINNNGEYIQNLYNYSDFSTKRFFDLKEGIGEIVISDDYNNTSEMLAEVYETYASV